MNATDGDIGIPAEREEVSNDQIAELRGKAILKVEKIKEDEQSPILYVRSIPTDIFYLVLQGSVVVCSGSEGFMCQIGPFDYLGVDALELSDFKPDYSAKVINFAKVLKLTRADYLKFRT
jgi:hypothetical protein